MGCTNLSAIGSTRKQMAITLTQLTAFLAVIRLADGPPPRTWFVLRSAVGPAGDGSPAVSFHLTPRL
jgi:hypothetical protein